MKGDFRVGDWFIQPEVNTLSRAGETAQVEPKAMEVLVYLAKHPGEVLYKERIIQAVWSDTFVTDDVLSGAIFNLRKALGDDAREPRFIQTIPKKGYRLVAPVRASQPDFEAQIRRLKKQLRSVLVGACALLMVVVLAAVVAIRFWDPKSTPESPLRKFSLPGHWAPVISPNGRYIAYIAPARGKTGPPADAKILNPDASVWVYDLAGTEPREIEGSETIQRPAFWSPDSDFIGFGVGADLMKASVRGGPAVLVGRMPTGHVEDGTWSPDGEAIVVQTLTGVQPHSLGIWDRPSANVFVYEVPAKGGTPSLLLDAEDFQGAPLRSPHFLPSRNGRILLGSAGIRIVLRDLDTGEQKVLGRGERPVYSSTGHILYEHEGRIWALPFSLETLTSTGESYAIVPSGLYRFPSVAADGTLAYLDSGGEWQLRWYDRDGTKMGVIGQPQKGILSPALSPGADRVAASDYTDIWVHEVARPIKSRVTVHPAMDVFPIWSPSGEELVFMSHRGFSGDIFVTPAHGGEVKTVVSSPAEEIATDWSRAGNSILYYRIEPETPRSSASAARRSDLWYLQRKGDSDTWEPVPFLQTPFRDVGGKFSPDGRFVAYVSDESGSTEVYVRPFPEGGDKVRVSSSGGMQPRWRRDGKEIYYVQGRTLMAAPISTEPDISVDSVEMLFPVPGLGLVETANYDVSPDGQRFVIPEPVQPDSVPAVRVIQNWFAEFRDRESSPKE